MPFFQNRGDPYLGWSAAHAFAGHAAMQADPSADVPVLLDLAPGHWAALQVSGLARIPSAYIPEDRYITALVASADLAAVATLVTQLEFCLPLRTAPAATQFTQPAESNAPVVLAVIDRGCAFLHQTLRNPMNPQSTRLLALWDQGTQLGLQPWAAPEGFLYGRELTGPAINALIATMSAQGLDETAIYRSADYLMDTRQRLREFAHGTHVLDTAAGRVLAPSSRSSTKPDEDDAASGVPLIFVDVPDLSEGDTTGAASSAFMMDALRYIRRRAGPKAQVVVNISLGALAGPHDGTSLFEKAMDHVLLTDGRMLLTLAGGNAGDAEVDRWHASGCLTKGATAEFLWRLRPDDPTDSFVELWFKAQDGGNAAVSVQLTAPDGSQIAWRPLQPGAAILPGQQPDCPRAAIYTRTAGDRGTDTMALVAVAPCTGARAAAPAGLWCIEVQAEGDQTTPFDAWIQRDEPVWEGGVPVQSFFEAVHGAAKLTGLGSLSSLATGKNTFVVGAADATTGTMTLYTSRGAAPGPTRRDGRDIDTFEIADESPTVIGLLAAGVLSGTWVRMGGTSVAAPRLARRLVNDLAAGRLRRPPARAWPPTPELVDAARPRLQVPPPPQRPRR